MLDLGLSRKQIRRRAGEGILHRLHAGVFVVGSPVPTPTGRLRAATLAVRDRGWISHIWAGHLWGICAAPPGRWIDVLTERGVGHPRTGIFLRQTRWLPEGQRGIRDGIQVTSPERALLDLAAVLSPERLQRAFEEADRLRLLDRARLEEVMAGGSGRRGAGALAALARRQAGPPPKARSNQEMRMYRLCEKARLPLPEMNEQVAGYEVDCLWRDLRLVIELDSSFHDSPLARERDRRKDLALERAGHRVHRMGPELVYDDPAVTVEHTRELIRLRAAELGIHAPGLASIPESALTSGG